MVAINTGYTNYYTNPAAVTNSPSNFGPAQVTNDDNRTKDEQAKLQQGGGALQAAAGYTTPNRGQNLNISV